MGPGIGLPGGMFTFQPLPKSGRVDGLQWAAVRKSAHTDTQLVNVYEFLRRVLNTSLNSKLALHYFLLLFFREV